SGTSGGTGAGRVQRATGSGYLVDGEVIEASIEGIGTLRHRIVAETSVPDDLTGSQLPPTRTYRNQGTALHPQERAFPGRRSLARPAPRPLAGVECRDSYGAPPVRRFQTTRTGTAQHPRREGAPASTRPALLPHPGRGV